MGFKNRVLVCASIESETTEEMVKSIGKAKEEGADLVELCMDSLAASSLSDVELLLKQRALPTIVSFRLRRGRVPRCRCTWKLDATSGRWLMHPCHVPVIVRAVGDRGLISQLLGPKYGAFMVCGSLGGRSVPGLPPLLSLKNVYELDNVDVDTKVFGVVSNPVGHSKGPLLHNPAFRYCRYNGIYVPLLVDNIKEFLRVYSCADFAGFSIGLPHKEAAVACCDEVDPLAKSIGAVNTIIRRPTDGKLVGYNTDCDACITAIEDALQERQTSNGEVTNVSPIAGRLFVLVGAGGAGRALAFGAKSKGARVVIFNRNFERAQCLARAVSGEALPIEQLETYCPENGMILANCSAIGMEPDVHLTPVSKEHLRSYDLVFDAVYTPRNTRLLQEAAEVGVTIVSGVEMFIRQALGQFKLFTNGLAPEDFMRKVVLEQF
ncbi:3-dehydroquinate dehydratase type I [Artemisia annua]|uniref:3-dehydroquinate dehydratase type I n=1 Tax=Artemisia annua TaxID=35608 RepID=A0A2U1P2P6_ARTAN|nr:3-dehydroquinate dehydratase type I [Artemisia annua]